VKREAELAVARRFCKQIGARILEQRESPDFLVEKDGPQVGLELARYREQGPHNDAQERDQALKEHLSDRWIDDANVNECWLSWTYKEDPTSSIPRKENWEEFTSELKKLTIEHHTSSGRVSVHFVPGAEVARRQTARSRSK
jgi:hypothetical protein